MVPACLSPGSLPRSVDSKALLVNLLCQLTCEKEVVFLRRMAWHLTWLRRPNQLALKCNYNHHLRRNQPRRPKGSEATSLGLAALQPPRLGPTCILQSHHFQVCITTQIPGPG